MKTVTKTIMYRIYQSFLISPAILFVITGDLILSFSFGLAEFFFKFISYYVFEKIWEKIRGVKIMNENENSEKPKINYTAILVGFILVISVSNLFLIFSLDNKINSLTGQAIKPSDLKEARPLGGTEQPKLDIPSKIDVSADDDSVKGPADAPITIIEFSDYECPFCARAEPTLSQIFEKYPGKVKLIYRDFPLNFHANAQKAAEASECAGEQGKYWDMHDKLFEKGVEGGAGTFKQYAKDIGLDTAKFNSCLDSGQMADEVKKDFQDGGNYGVTGTPAFFINGISIVGAQPFSVFEQIIEQELNK